MTRARAAAPRPPIKTATSGTREPGSGSGWDQGTKTTESSAENDGFYTKNDGFIDTGSACLARPPPPPPAPAVWPVTGTAALLTSCDTVVVEFTLFADCVNKACKTL